MVFFNTNRVLSFQTFIPANKETGLAVDSKSQPEQIRAVDYSRFVARLGTVSTREMAELEEALQLHLGI